MDFYPLVKLENPTKKVEGWDFLIVAWWIFPSNWNRWILCCHAVKMMVIKSIISRWWHHFDGDQILILDEILEEVWKSIPKYPIYPTTRLPCPCATHPAPGAAGAGISSNHCWRTGLHNHFQTSMHWFKGTFTGKPQKIHGKIDGFRWRFPQQTNPLSNKGWGIFSWDHWWSFEGRPGELFLCWDYWFLFCGSWKWWILGVVLRLFAGNFKGASDEKVRLLEFTIYPLVNKHSYWTWSFIVDLPIKKCNFHSYVSIPEGIISKQ